MENNLRCVVGKNVLTSALLSSSGTPNRAVRIVLRHGQLLSSDSAFEEPEEILNRPKFDPYLRAEDRDTWQAPIYTSSEFVA